MKKRLAISIAFSAVLFLFGVEIAVACTCSGGANPCGFFRAPKGIAFIGTVTAVVETNEKYGKPIKGKARKITIKVDEIFKGTLPNEIVTSDDGYLCDNYPFKLGKTYLIYSPGVLENTENIVPVGLCSGTAPIQNAQESINFLRQLKDGNTFSILYGKLQQTINDEKNPYQHLAKTKVVLTKIYAIENGQYKDAKKKERNRETFTDENGEYEFENLADGKYKLNAVLPNGLWMPEYREFGAGGKPFCENHPLYVFSDGRISGNAVNADGTPARLALSIMALDKDTRFYYVVTRTDEKGNFTFSGLNEGRYKIYVGLTSYSLDGARTYLFSGDFPYPKYYFPNTLDYNDAEIITLDHSQKIQNIDFKMPQAPIKRNITGIVEWEDGKPAAKGAVIYYRLKKLGERSPRYVYIKEDATFSIQIYEEFEYEISAATNSQENNGSAGWVLLDKKDLGSQIKLVLKPKR